MNKRTLVVTIGRNINGEPMPTERWNSFKAAIATVLSSANGSTIVTRPTYSPYAMDSVGVWEGKQEATGVFVALVPNDYLTLAVIERGIRMAAAMWSQDAIGFINVLGAEHLLKPIDLGEREREQFQASAIH